MWVAVVFIGLLAYDVWQAMWFTDPATGAGTLRHRPRHGHHGASTSCCSRATPGAATCCATSSAAGMDEVSKSPVCDFAYACVSGLNGRHQLFAWCSLISVMSTDVYIRLCSMGVHHRPEDLLMGAPQTYQYDVLDHRRRRRRTARGDRSGRGGREGRADLQVAARQGAHRDGRRRHGGRAWRTTTIATTGWCISRTRCAAASTSTTGAWPNCMRRKRPIACASSRRGARCSTARRTAASISATSAATGTRGWRTSATAPASN